MAATDWYPIYRTYTDDELVAEMAELKAQLSPFSQQTQGQKSFVRDLKEIRDRLQAVTFIQRERGTIVIAPPAVNVGEGITDFSGIQ